MARGLDRSQPAQLVDRPLLEGVRHGVEGDLSRQRLYAIWRHHPPPPVDAAHTAIQGGVLVILGGIELAHVDGALGPHVFPLRRRRKVVELLRRSWHIRAHLPPVAAAAGLVDVRRQCPLALRIEVGLLKARSGRWERVEAGAFTGAEHRVDADEVPLPREHVRIGGRAVELGVVRAEPPLPRRRLPRRRRVALRVLDDGVVRRLGPVGEELVGLVVRWHRLREQRARRAARPVVFVAQPRVDLNDAARAVGPGAVDDDGAAGEDGLVVVRRAAGGGGARVNPVPDGDRHRCPVEEIFRDEVAVVGAVAGGRGKVDLVEVVDHAVHRVEDGAVGVVLPAAVLIHQVERRRVGERRGAVLVPGEAGAGAAGRAGAAELRRVLVPFGAGGEAVLHFRRQGDRQPSEGRHRLEFR
mmetsp:Transcript_44547/g.110903  ORF Transcript_44547/g.110903 Transcript_44547/m.110903 type:complete len:412 (-) Transcript_44547:23-1258(-)